MMRHFAVEWKHPNPVPGWLDPASHPYHSLGYILDPLSASGDNQGVGLAICLQDLPKLHQINRCGIKAHGGKPIFYLIVVLGMQML